MSMIKKTFFILFIIWPVFFTEELAAEYLPVQSWQYYLERGRKQFNARMYDYSFDSITKALKKNPRSFEAANILARIYIIQKDKINAKKNYIRSLNINDAQPDIHNSLGEIEEFFLNYKSALAHYEKAVSHDDEHITAMINYSRILYKTGQPEKARRTVDEAHTLGLPLSIRIIEKARSADKFAEKEKLYKETLRVNPAHTEAYIELSTLYRGSGDFESAAEILEVLKKVRPGDAKAYIHLGNIYFNRKLRGNTRQYFLGLAVKNYLAAAELKKNDPDLYLRIAAIFRYTGRDLKAAEYENKALLLMNKK